jgi:hypothetical protein
MVRSQVNVNFAKQSVVANGPVDRQTFFLTAAVVEEVNQRQALAVEVAVDQTFVGTDGGRWERTRCWFPPDDSD